ncbi:ABC transporter permease [Aquimarina macrocephali]|uniref:ABC transporter permease n=1 Tax=Aquimarina macrocephali TaxID=666563 RepID=UPI0012692AC5|nr:FtsX-like permease family protein [Aquimarina macrocephali]
MNTILSVLLLLLSISLTTFVLQVRNQLNQHLENNTKPFDMVIGAKGSPLQLVLSSVLHIDDPTGNIPLDEALKIARNPMVKEMIPVSYGDNYRGYRVLGTSNEYLAKYDATLQEGKLYEKPFEVVIGNDVAKKINLQIGDTFASAHGLAENGLETHDEKPFIVTGVLKPTGAIIDHLIITNLQSIWEVHEHSDEHNHHEEEHEEQREITSLLVKFRNPMGALQMSRLINEKTTMQAALPKFEIERLMRFLGIGFRTINGIAIAILLVAGLSIFINLIKTVRERKQELALLRTYGANTFQLIKLVFLEALFLSLLGSILGWFLGRISIWFFSIFTENIYGYHFVFSFPTNKELLILILVILTTFLAAILASLPLFKLNVSKTISDA